MEAGLVLVAVTICFMGLFWLMPALVGFWESSKEFIYNNLKRLNEREARRQRQGRKTDDISVARRALHELNEMYTYKRYSILMFWTPGILYVLGIIYGIVAISVNTLCGAYQAITILAFVATVTAIGPLWYKRTKLSILHKLTKTDEFYIINEDEK